MDRSQPLIDAAHAGGPPGTQAFDSGCLPQAEQAMQHAALAVLQAAGTGLVPALTRYLATVLGVWISGQLRGGVKAAATGGELRDY